MKMWFFCEKCCIYYELLYNYNEEEKMKKHNLFKVLGITILLVVFLSWLLPSAYYSEGLVEGVRHQVGLFDLFSYPTVVFSYFSYVVLYILAIGAFYAVLNKIGAYRRLIDKLVKGFANREWLLLGLMIVKIALITSLTGATLPILFIFPFIISVVLAMGYNKLTAAYVTLGSIAVGYIGSIYMSDTISLTHSILGLKENSEIISRIIILILCLAILIYNVLKYARENKNTKLADIKEYVPSKADSKSKIWPLVVVYDLILLILIMGMIPWDSLFKLNIFVDATNWVKEFTISKFTILYKILGEITAIGTWGLTQYIIVLIVGMILLALIYRVKFDDFIDMVVEGAKKYLKAAVLVTLAYVILIIVTYHPFQLTIIKFLLELTKGFNIITMSVVGLLSAFFNVETYYASHAVLNYAKEVITDTGVYPLMAVLIQAMNGIALLIAPTSVVLLVTLSYLNISFVEWIKHVAKLLLELMLMLFIVFVIMMLI